MSQKSFQPDIPFALPLLPPVLAAAEGELFAAVVKASRALAELNGRLQTIANPLLLLSPAILREAVASSEIENIHTTVAELLQAQLFSDPEVNEADKEVLRYNEAVKWGYAQLDSLPLSSRLIQGIHRKLMPSWDGQYKKMPNKIENTRTRQAVYSPPLPQDVPGLIANWEQFVNTDTPYIDPLVQVAIAHYQFEAIHPFADGNGRTGRILMVLQLVQYGLLDLPILYISGYINQNRAAYYKLLLAVSAEEAWYPYIQFMLEGFYQQAVKTKRLLLDVATLYEDSLAQLRTLLPPSFNVNALLDVLFTYPVCTPTLVAQQLGLAPFTVRKYLGKLTPALLHDFRRGRMHLYVNRALVELLSK